MPKILAYTQIESKLKYGMLKRAVLFPEVVDAEVAVEGPAAND